MTARGPCQVNMHSGHIRGFEQLISFFCGCVSLFHSPIKTFPNLPAEQVHPSEGSMLLLKVILLISFSVHLL